MLVQGITAFSAAGMADSRSLLFFLLVLAILLLLAGALFALLALRAQRKNTLHMHSLENIDNETR